MVSGCTVLAAEDAKCCRLSPEPTAASDLAEGEPGVLADDDDDRATQTWCSFQYVLVSSYCASACRYSLLDRQLLGNFGQDYTEVVDDEAFHGYE